MNVRELMTVNQDMPPRSAGRSPHRPGGRSPAAPQDPLEGEAASRQASVGRGNLRCPLRGLTALSMTTAFCLLPSGENGLWTVDA